MTWTKTRVSGKNRHWGFRDGVTDPNSLALAGPRMACGTIRIGSMCGPGCGGFIDRRRETSDHGRKSRDMCAGAGGESRGPPGRPPRQMGIDRGRRGCCRGRGETVGWATRNALPRGSWVLLRWMAMLRMPIPQRNAIMGHGVVAGEKRRLTVSGQQGRAGDRSEMAFGDHVKPGTGAVN